MLFGKPAAALVTVVRGKQVSTVAEDVAELTRRGWELKQEIDRLGVELREINERLLTAFGVGVKLRIARQASASLSEQRRWQVSDEPGLRRLLGSRWDDLVIASYRPEPKLIEIASGDDDVAKAIAATLAYSAPRSVTWRASAK